MPHTFRMNSLDATTPNLKVFDRLFEAYRTRDANNLAPVLSKSFVYRSFPKIADLPDRRTKDQHIEFLGLVFAMLARLDHTFHEAIEAPGKAVVHWTALCTPHSGAAFEYDSVSILTLAEEDGELKVLEFKDFTDPEKRANLYKVLSEGGQIA